MADQNDLREMKFKEMEERLQRKERKLDLFQAQTLELSEALAEKEEELTKVMKTSKATQAMAAKEKQALKERLKEKEIEISDGEKRILAFMSDAEADSEYHEDIIQKTNALHVEKQMEVAQHKEEKALLVSTMNEEYGALKEEYEALKEEMEEMEEMEEKMAEERRHFQKREAELLDALDAALEELSEVRDSEISNRQNLENEKSNTEQALIDSENRERHTNTTLTALNKAQAEVIEDLKRQLLSSQESEIEVKASSHELKTPFP